MKISDSNNPAKLVRDHPVIKVVPPQTFTKVDHPVVAKKRTVKNKS